MSRRHRARRARGLRLTTRDDRAFSSREGTFPAFDDWPEARIVPSRLRCPLTGGRGCSIACAMPTHREPGCSVALALVLPEPLTERERARIASSRRLPSWPLHPRQPGSRRTRVVSWAVPSRHGPVASEGSHRCESVRWRRMWRERRALPGRRARNGDCRRVATPQALQRRVRGVRNDGDDRGRDAQRGRHPRATHRLAGAWRE